jgi:hypothetical protein
MKHVRMKPSLNRQLAIGSFLLAAIFLSLSLYAQDGNAGAPIEVA